MSNSSSGDVRKLARVLIIVLAMICAWIIWTQTGDSNKPADGKTAVNDPANPADSEIEMGQLRDSELLHREPINPNGEVVEATFDLRVKVFLAEHEAAPVAPGVTVSVVPADARLEALSGITNEMGEAVFTGIPPDSVIVQASLGELHSAVSDVKFESWSKSPIRLWLPAKATIAVTLLGGEDLDLFESSLSTYWDVPQSGAATASTVIDLETHRGVLLERSHRLTVEPLVPLWLAVVLSSGEVVASLEVQPLSLGEERIVSLPLNAEEMVMAEIKLRWRVPALAAEAESRPSVYSLTMKHEDGRLLKSRTLVGTPPCSFKIPLKREVNYQFLLVSPAWSPHASIVRVADDPTVTLLLNPPGTLLLEQDTEPVIGAFDTFTLIPAPGWPEVEVGVPMLDAAGRLVFSGLGSLASGIVFGDLFIATTISDGGVLLLHASTDQEVKHLVDCRIKITLRNAQPHSVIVEVRDGERALFRKQVYSPSRNGGSFFAVPAFLPDVPVEVVVFDGTTGLQLAQQRAELQRQGDTVTVTVND